MAKRFPDAPDPAASGDTNVQPGAAQTTDVPILDQADELFEAYRLAWAREWGKCADELRKHDFPGRRVASLFECAIDEWRAANAMLAASGENKIAELTEELAAFKRGRGATVEDCRAIARQTLLVERELAEAKLRQGTRDQAIGVMGILESYLPALFGKSLGDRRPVLGGRLPPRTLAAAELAGAGTEYTNQWRTIATRPTHNADRPYRTIQAAM
ncbi:MAG: hypothetical protein ACYC4U_20860 [Pirellulaceae bacterium]